MNNELMRDENFIRCSTMVAELLMKYKSKEMELGGESKEDSPPSFFAFLQHVISVVRTHAQVYVLLRLGITLTGKEICHAQLRFAPYWVNSHSISLP